MLYKKQNSIHVIEIPINEFKLIMVNQRKRTAAKKNYVNAGFFAVYHENGTAFTLPVGHTKCDFDTTDKWVTHYCKERGTFSGTKFTFDSSKWSYMNPLYGNAVSTLIVTKTSAYIQDIKSISTVQCEYALSGVPIMRNGADVKFATYVKNQGWEGGSLYGTWHIFAGTKKAIDNKIYIMGMRTYRGNMITSAEAYKAFVKLGFYDVIKLDGGGSYIMNINGKEQYTSENRRINTIITFDPINSTESNNKYGKPTILVNGKKNIYPTPIRTLRQGSKGLDVRWLQFKLNQFGIECDIDGKFGPGTRAAVEEYQRVTNLDDDGSVGPATRAMLKTIK